MKFLYCIVVSLSALSASAAYGDEPKVPAEHAGVFFKGSQSLQNQNFGFVSKVQESKHPELAKMIKSDKFAQPYVGIRLNKKAFTQFLVASASEGTKVEAIQKAVDMLFAKDLRPADRLIHAQQAFCIHIDSEFALDANNHQDHESVACQVFEVLFDAESSALTLLVRTSYNIGLVLEWKPEGFLSDAGMTVKPGRYLSDVLKWQKRFSLEASSDLTRTDIRLLNGENKVGVRGKLSANYTGFNNPLARLTRDASYYDFTIDAMLSEFDLDEKSTIEVGLGGISDWKAVRIPRLATIIGTKLVTSQSLNRVSTLYDLRYRIGDQRTTGKGFYAVDEALKGPYLEFGAQVGYSFDRHIDDDIPDGDEGWLLRPVVLIGLAKQNFFGAEITGNLTYYYLPKTIGRAMISDSWGETFDLSLAFGPENQRLIFSVSGGRNISDGFTKATPTYSVGVKIKL